jgi:hypothetical protein
VKVEEKGGREGEGCIYVSGALYFATKRMLEENDMYM